MIRCIVAVICGIIAGGVFNIALIMLSWAIYRPPEGTDMSNPETMKAYIDALPLPGFLLVLAAHAGGALVGGFVAALIAGRSALVLGAIVGGLFLLGGVINLLSIPRPVWFAIVDVVLYVPCGIIGAKLAPCRTSPAALDSSSP
jgi:hypothetical protein